MEKVANELSVAMKTGNGKGIKESASKLHVLHKKKMKESNEKDKFDWNDIIRCAIDSDLQCNICFEIFIKVLDYNIISNCLISFI